MSLTRFAAAVALSAPAAPGRRGRAKCPGLDIVAVAAHAFGTATMRPVPFARAGAGTVWRASCAGDRDRRRSAGGDGPVGAVMPIHARPIHARPRHARPRHARRWAATDAPLRNRRAA